MPQRCSEKVCIFMTWLHIQRESPPSFPPSSPIGFDFSYANDGCTFFLFITVLLICTSAYVCMHVCMYVCKYVCIFAPCWKWNTGPCMCWGKCSARELHPQLSASGWAPQGTEISTTQWLGSPQDFIPNFAYIC